VTIPVRGKETRCHLGSLIVDWYIESSTEKKFPEQWCFTNLDVSI